MRVLGSVLQLAAIAVFAVAWGLLSLWMGMLAGSVGMFAVGFQLERLSQTPGSR